MKYSVAIPSNIQLIAAENLIRDDGQEDLCFALWYPSQGQTRKTALIKKLILPEKDERHLHGNVSFSADYLDRALSVALKENAGLALMHSHLGPGWQGMSLDDVKAEIGHAAAVKGATGLPFIGLTIGDDQAWSARFWEKTSPRKYEKFWCESVRIVGKGLSITYTDQLVPIPKFREELIRTTSAWGEEKQAVIGRLRIGVVGTGSVGSIIAEALARMGVSNIKLIDFDSVELLNLDRLLHASNKDVGLAKVKVLSKALFQSATAEKPNIESIESSIVEEDGFRSALDCDILFSCVDRPWPRSALNFVAYSHLIPVVDGGILISTTKKRTLRGADWKAHIAAPTRKCLECLGQYDPGLVSADREGYFDDPDYIRGLEPDHPAKRNENVFAFSLAAASLQVMQMLSMVVAPSGYSNIGEQNYHFVTGEMDITTGGECKETCLYPGLIALGDRSGIKVTGKHVVAEESRERRRAAASSWNKFINWLRSKI